MLHRTQIGSPGQTLTRIKPAGEKCSSTHTAYRICRRRYHEAGAATRAQQTGFVHVILLLCFSSGSKCMRVRSSCKIAASGAPEVSYINLNPDLALQSDVGKNTSELSMSPENASVILSTVASAAVSFSCRTVES